MTPRLAIVVSHPIQYFAPWHREVARLKDVELKVFFCCDWGAVEYIDPHFKRPVKWDVPLLDGYRHEFLSIKRSPERLGFWEVDNPEVGKSLDRFDPDVVQVFGYAHRTNWRVAGWTRRHRKPLLIVSDSNARAQPRWWKRAAKQIVVRRFYNRVDGALCVSENNRNYHAMYGIPSDRLFPGVLPIDRGRLLDSVTDRQSARRLIREQLGIPQGAFVVMFCGKYAAHKRPLDLVIAAWRAAQKGLPVWSLLVGEGPERAVIEQHCRDEAITNAVMTGFINQAGIAQYYAACDAIALTSSREPYGLAVTEGASFALPIIVSDRVGCVGSTGVARPGVNAMVYPCGSVENLQKAIERLCRDGELYERMSSASSRISEGQDVTAAARLLVDAARRLSDLGPR